MNKARVYESRFLNGDIRGYQAECEQCDWRGPVHSSTRFAYDDGANHKHVWYVDPNNVADLVRTMHEEEPMTTEQVIVILDKPWKWTPEYEAMRAAGKGTEELAS